jgi:hypothetical protein
METAKEGVASKFSPWEWDVRYNSALGDPTLQGEPVDAATVVVIPTAESVEQDPNLIETTSRDLNIMCRIFDKELGLSSRAEAIGTAFIFSADEMNLWPAQQLGQVPTFFGEKARETRSMYLEGYGAIFFVKVGFQLTAPPQAGEEDKETETDVDPVWRLTEQEIYEPEKLKKRRAVSAAGEYNEGKVEDLKRRLIRVLKHSANIRSLKPDEQLIVTARGPKLAMGPAKVLSIRAKKSDIDAFAKGEADFDEFRKKVQILVY